MEKNLFLILNDLMQENEQESRVIGKYSFKKTKDFKNLFLKNYSKLLDNSTNLSDNNGKIAKNMINLEK